MGSPNTTPALALDGLEHAADWRPTEAVDIDLFSNTDLNSGLLNTDANFVPADVAAIRSSLEPTGMLGLDELAPTHSTLEAGVFETGVFDRLETSNTHGHEEHEEHEEHSAAHDAAHDADLADL